MKTAIYPGSFDPITLGHLDVIQRASAIFDKVIVCVMVNSEKKYLFSETDRVDYVKTVTKDLPNVSVETSNGLLASFARDKGSCVLIKGLRNASDFDMEMQMSHINRTLDPELDTLFLTASGKYAFLSSTAAREMLRYGAELEGFLPHDIIEPIKSKMSII